MHELMNAEAVAGVLTRPLLILVPAEPGVSIVIFEDNATLPKGA